MVYLADLGYKLSCIGRAYDRVDDFFIPVGKRAFAVDQSSSVTAGCIDHLAHSVGHVGDDKKCSLLIDSEEKVQGLS